ncbi:YvrJ family protein [Bacillus salipaludis]|uniref:YvrJ family protein n=1 Tax=Bacillus salipaludis TaxID=2547811 RepID=A0A4R5VYB5_9BACI|nr:YvrJ family protein [Bacillus salipaludis]TDK64233.1 YvrJ family protein [Bacillus salipaludis]
MEQIIPIISEVGFPIVVTLYLLYRIEAKLDMVVQSIQSLPDRMKGQMK